MEERILNLLSLCMQAKRKGHDVFFYYSPHVQSIDITSYRDGWKNEVDEHGNTIADYKDIHISFYVDCLMGEIEESIENAETYLKGLIDA